MDRFTALLTGYSRYKLIGSDDESGEEARQVADSDDGSSDESVLNVKVDWYIFGESSFVKSSAEPVVKSIRGLETLPST